MKRFRLTIELGNEAMQTPHDVSNALAELATRFADDHSPCGPDHGRVRDLNGNHVGEWAFR